MTYAANGTFQATDFNTFVGVANSNVANTINRVWSAGQGSAGYGQTAVSNVTANSTVLGTTSWTSLVSNTANAALHQNSTITALTVPSAGNVITFFSALQTNLSTIFTNRLNAVAQGTTVTNTVTRSTTWSTLLTFTHTISFANGDAARYFFNAGGQFAITCSHTGPNAIDTMFTNLASNVGTIVISAQNSGNIIVAATTYQGVTKVGGGDNANSTISNSFGYYGLTTANANVFTQTAFGGPTGYQTSFIRLITKSSTANVSGNLDNGNVINIYTIWDEIPDGLIANGNTRTTLTVRPPATTYIANQWGTITITGTVA